LWSCGENKFLEAIHLILELMSTVECYDCHEMVQDLKAHRLECTKSRKAAKGKGGKIKTEQCFGCKQWVKNLAEHTAECTNPLAEGESKNVSHVVEAEANSVVEEGNDDDKEDIYKDQKDVYLLFDLSSSMSGNKLDQVKNAAISLHEALDEKDRLAIISFDTKAYWRLKPRPNGQIKRQEELGDILGRIRAQGATAMYDAIVMAITQLRSKEQKTQIIVLTDGEDNISKATHQDVLNLLEEYPAVSLNILLFASSYYEYFSSMVGVTSNPKLYELTSKSHRGEFKLVSELGVVSSTVRLASKNL
jgi:Mg-chelatase subunit ChlD